MKTGVTVRTLDPVGVKPPREGGRKVPHRGTFYFIGNFTAAKLSQSDNFLALVRGFAEIL